MGGRGECSSRSKADPKHDKTTSQLFENDLGEGKKEDGVSKKGGKEEGFDSKVGTHTNRTDDERATLF